MGDPLLQSVKTTKSKNNDFLTRGSLLLFVKIGLNSVVAGLKMAQLLEISLSFLICGADPDGARV
jgi:hypothetical protein